MTLFTKIVLSTQQKVFSAILDYKNITEMLTGMTKRVISGEGYFHQNSYTLMHNDINQLYEKNKDHAFSAQMKDFLNIHNYGTRVLAASLRDEPMPDGFIETGSQYFKLLPMMLGYQTPYHPSVQLSPLLTLIPSMLLHYKVLGAGRQNGLQAKIDLESFSAWETVSSKSINDTFSSMTSEQRIGPHGGFSIAPMSPSQAKPAFSSIAVALAHLHYSRAPSDIYHQQEAIKLLKTAWSLDDINAQKKIIHVDDFLFLSFAKNSLMGWDATQSKNKSPDLLRSEAEANRRMTSMTQLKPRL